MGNSYGDEGPVDTHWPGPFNAAGIEAGVEYAQACAADAREARVAAIRRHEQAIAYHRGALDQLQVDVALASGWWGCLRWLLTGRVA